MGGQRSARSHHGGSQWGGSNYDGDAHAERSEQVVERIDRKMRVVAWNEVVDLSNSELEDMDTKILMRMLEEAEEAANHRLKKKNDAHKLAEKAKAEANVGEFNPFEPNAEEDPEEIEYREASQVAWPMTRSGSKPPNRPKVPSQRNRRHLWRSKERRPAVVPLHAALAAAQWEQSQMRGTKSSASAGRAKILFRKAMRRYNLRQKSFIADAASTAVDYEEAAKGCHHLSLQNNLIGSLSAAHLGGYLRKSRCLETLALGGNALGDAGAALLGRALQHSRSLKTLALQDCQIGHKGIRHLCGGLALNRHLTSLWLLRNQAQDEGAAYLAGALRTCKLERLGLESNGLRVRGMEALGFALSFEHRLPTDLRPHHNQLGDEGSSRPALHVNRPPQASARAVGIGEGAHPARLRDSTTARVSDELGLRILHVEDNDMASQATEPLIRAMRVSKTLTSLSLDLVHGGSYDREQTAEDLRKSMTLAFLGRKAREKESIFG